MKDICKSNLGNIVIEHINTNLIRSKFDLLVEQIKQNIDVLVVSVAIIDKSFSFD